jgi:predicted ATP-dependent Lon-type protease
MQAIFDPRAERSMTYCASNDEVVIAEGLRTVKKILAENYVRPDEGKGEVDDP